MVSIGRPNRHHHFVIPPPPPPSFPVSPSPPLVPAALPLPQLLDKLLYPGETILTWQSLNIDAYLAKLAMGMARLEELVQKVNGIIDNRMQSNLKVISRTLLVHLPEDESFSLDQFVKLQESHIKEQSEFIDVKNVEVRRPSLPHAPPPHRAHAVPRRCHQSIVLSCLGG